MILIRITLGTESVSACSSAAVLMAKLTALILSIRCFGIERSTWSPASRIAVPFDASMSSSMRMPRIQYRTPSDAQSFTMICGQSSIGLRRAETSSRKTGKPCYRDLRE